MNGTIITVTVGLTIILLIIAAFQRASSGGESDYYFTDVDDESEEREMVGASDNEAKQASNEYYPTGLGKFSMVVGILSILSIYTGAIVGIVLSLSAVISGAIATKKVISSKKSEVEIDAKKVRRHANIGITTGVIGFVLSILLVVIPILYNGVRENTIRSQSEYSKATNR